MPLNGVPFDEGDEPRFGRGRRDIQRSPDQQRMSAHDRAMSLTYKVGEVIEVLSARNGILSHGDAARAETLCHRALQRRCAQVAVGVDRVIFKARGASAHAAQHAGRANSALYKFAVEGTVSRTLPA